MLHLPDQKGNLFTTSSVLVWLVELLGVLYVFPPSSTNFLFLTPFTSGENSGRST